MNLEDKNETGLCAARFFVQKSTIDEPEYYPYIIACAGPYASNL
jgi:hypothetical protein